MRDINHPKSTLKRAVNLLASILTERMALADLVRVSSDPVGFIHVRIEQLTDEKAEELIKSLRWVFCPAIEIEEKWGSGSILTE